MKYPSRRTVWPWLILAVVTCVVVLRLRWGGAPVEVHAVGAGEIVGDVLGTGTLEARIKTTISPRIQERLAAVLVDQGDSVRTGQLLARLDDAELQQQAAIAEAVLASAKATVERVRADEARAQAVLRQAQLDHQRLLELVAAKTTSQADLDKAVESLRVAEADLRRSQAAIAEVRSQVFTAEKTLLYRREQLAFTEIRSPYDGWIIRRDRDPGGVVVPGSSLLQLVATNEIWVSAWVDETALSRLATNQPARVSFRSEPSRIWPGTIARLGREADRETREFVVEIRLPQLPENWILGQRAEVFLETGRKTGALTVPSTYVAWRDGRSGVFVHHRPRAVWREVSVGLRGRMDVEITSGLSAGEQIVKPVGGASHPLTDGQRVQIQ